MASSLLTAAAVLSVARQAVRALVARVLSLDHDADGQDLVERTGRGLLLRERNEATERSERSERAETNEPREWFGA